MLGRLQELFAVLWKKKYERALKLTQERAQEREQKLDKNDISEELEKGDLLAMLISGFLVLWPAGLVVLLLVAAAGYFFFMR